MSISILPAVAQQPSAAIKIANTASTSQVIPPHLIYRHFLKWVVDLDNKAQAAGATDPYKFAEPFSKRAGLQHAQLDAIRSEARALDKDLAGKDAEAAAVVARFRAVGQDALRNGLSLPVAPANLRELQQQRDTLIRSHVSILRAALGPDGATKLDRYLAVEFAPHVSLKALAVPHLRTLPPAR